jgi:hypothetical protein
MTAYSARFFTVQRLSGRPVAESFQSVARMLHLRIAARRKWRKTVVFPTFTIA